MNYAMCPRCGESMPLGSFVRRRRTLVAWCASCRAESTTEATDEDIARLITGEQSPRFTDEYEVS